MHYGLSWRDHFAFCRCRRKFKALFSFLATGALCFCCLCMPFLNGCTYTCTHTDSPTHTLIHAHTHKEEERRKKNLYEQTQVAFVSPNQFVPANIALMDGFLLSCHGDRLKDFLAVASTFVQCGGVCPGFNQKPADVHSHTRTHNYGEGNWQKSAHRSESERVKSWAKILNKAFLLAFTLDQSVSAVCVFVQTLIMMRSLL